MKYYIISAVEDEYYNATSKAQNDVETVARDFGFERIPFRGQISAEGNKMKWLSFSVDAVRSWTGLLSGAESESTILLQYPLPPLKAGYFVRYFLPFAKRKKQLKFIALIHDLDSLRGFHGNTAIFWENKILPFFDVVICHNEAMKKYLTENGILEEKIIVLGIFDYLTNESWRSHDKNEGIAIAGNLSPEKSGYISHLIKNEHGKYPIHLYGKGLKEIPPDVVYHGVFPPEVLPSQMRGAFGLVWDGDSAETCAGPTGEYLRYNNPHKLSLYLASGMPVIIWKEAALSPFVVESEAGFAVESLYEIKGKINSISDEQYNKMKKNAQRIGKQLREGYYLRTALEKAVAITQGRV